MPKTFRRDRLSGGEVDQAARPLLGHAEAGERGAREGLAEGAFQEIGAVRGDGEEQFVILAVGQRMLDRRFAVGLREGSGGVAQGQRPEVDPGVEFRAEQAG